MLCDSKMCRRDFIASNVRILRLFMSALVSSFVPKSLHSFQFVDVFSGVTGCMLGSLHSFQFVDVFSGVTGCMLGSLHSFQFVDVFSGVTGCMFGVKIFNSEVSYELHEIFPMSYC